MVHNIIQGLLEALAQHQAVLSLHEGLEEQPSQGWGEGLMVVNRGEGKS